MKATFYVIDQSFVLHKVIARFKPQNISAVSMQREKNSLCYGEFPSKIFYISSGYLFFFFLNELNCCPQYRKRAIRYFRDLEPTKYVLRIEPGQRDALDYHWGTMTSQTIWEAIELDYIMSWLSTLGGAFSALGDYSPERAEIAGKISVHQLKLALRIGDPTTIARCKLYLSISLIQRGHFQLAKRLIREQYLLAARLPEPPRLLLNMCRGIWSKLVYTKQQQRLARFG